MGMNGVLDMAFLSIIRRWHKRDQVPIREISRRTGVSRNTVRKYLRSDVIEPKFQVPEAAGWFQKTSLDIWREFSGARERIPAQHGRLAVAVAVQVPDDVLHACYPVIPLDP
jgi:hypothetical protein